MTLNVVLVNELEMRRGKADVRVLGPLALLRAAARRLLPFLCGGRFAFCREPAKTPRVSMRSALRFWLGQAHRDCQSGLAGPILSL